MEIEKKKHGRPPKQKIFVTTGMTYEGAINNALDREVKADLDKSISNKSEDELTDDGCKYLKRKTEKKSCTLNVRFTESEMQDILSKCESMVIKIKRSISVIAFWRGMTLHQTLPRFPSVTA